MYISDVIDDKEMNSWKKGDVITIKAPTGRGKSRFIKYDLYEKAKREDKKILMLIHRRNCVDQFQMELEQLSKHDTGVIDIRTYQSIEAVERDGKLFQIGMYDYIVCDEFHYFMSDASFNIYTDLSLKRVLATNSIKIFMSATGNYVNEFLKENRNIPIKTYDDIKDDYSFIKKLNFFYENETIEEIAKDAIKNNRKTIFFIQSATKAFEFYEKFRQHSMFNCGKSHKLYENVDVNKVNDMLKNERFDDLLLFTTTVMDAGVNLIMSDLNTIIVDVEDTGTLIQCIGRKRLINKDDYINLYIRAINNQRLGGRETQAKKRVELGDFFKKYGEKALVQENYRRLNDAMIYDEPGDFLDKTESTKKLNLLMYFKVKTDLDEIYKIKKKSDKHAHARYLAEDILKVGHYTLMREAKESEVNGELNDYLESIVGEKLFKDQQKELIEKVDVRVNGRQQKSYRKINEGLKMINLDYEIKTGVDKRRKLDDGSNNQNRDKTYWEVTKI